jgi:hypothetical protein
MPFVDFWGRKQFYPVPVKEKFGYSLAGAPTKFHDKIVINAGK